MSRRICGTSTRPLMVSLIGKASRCAKVNSNVMFVCALVVVSFKPYWFAFCVGVVGSEVLVCCVT